MKKLNFKIITILLIVIILQTSMVFATSTKELENQQSENDKKINEAKSDLEDIKVEKSETVKQVEELSSKITDYQTQIEELEGKISNLNNKIENAQKELNKSQEDYTKQQELLNARLVATYEAGETSYLDVILSSKSITDLISNYYLVTELATNDSELLDKIQKQKEKIEQSKRELEDSRKEISNSKVEKQKVSDQLRVAKSEKSKQVEKLSADEKAIQEEIDELKESNIQIAKEIKKAQEQYAKQIAALNNKKSVKNQNLSSSSEKYVGGNGTLQRPVSSGSISAGMYYSSGSYHGAVDFAVPIGTPVYAAETGVVIKTANLTYSYGTYVVIQHANGLQTWYAHGTSGSICVSPGQTVSRGQKIMSSGNSGHSSGPHLHFEVRVAPYDYNTCRVNPQKYF